MVAFVIPGKSFNHSRRHLRLVAERAEPSNLPRTRADCEGGPRPCPLISCRHNLSADVTFAGGVRVHWLPEDEPDRPTCALDLAERQGMGERDVGEALGCSRERVRQIEHRALKKIARPMAKANR
jgi:hypothetical protein